MSEKGAEQPIRQASEPAGCGAISLPFVLIMLLLTVIAVVAGIKIMGNPSGFVAGVWIEQIGKTMLPAEQQQRMVTVVKDIQAKLERGEITQDQAKAVAKAIGESHAINTAMFYYVADHVQRRDEFAARDPEPTTRQLQRLVRGVAAGDTNMGESINKELAPLVSHNGRPKPKAKTQDLDKLFQRAKQLADEAGIPDEPYAVDAAAMFEQTVYAALGNAEQAEPDARE